MSTWTLTSPPSAGRLLLADRYDMSLDLLSRSGSKEFLTRYLRARLRVRSPVTFEVPAEPHAWPVFFARHNGAPRLVVKLVGSVRRALKIVCRSRFAVSRGAPVARLVGWTLVGRFGPLKACVVVHEYVAGRRCDGREGDLARLARAFADLHSISSTTLGILQPSLKRGGYFRRVPYIRFRLRQALARLVALEPFLDQKRIASLARSFAASAQPMWHRARHEFVHEDIKPGHYLLSEAGAVVIDLDEAHFGNFAGDLVAALHVLCGDHPDRRRCFLETYFRCVEGPTPAEFSAFEPFFHADLHLRAAGETLRQWADRRTDQAVFEARFEAELRSCERAFSPGS